MQGGNVAGMFFYYIAAFPSVAHTYIWKLMVVMGFPVRWVRAISRLYQNNKHTIKIGGSLFPGPHSMRCETGMPVVKDYFGSVAGTLTRMLQGVLGEQEGHLQTT